MNSFLQNLKRVAAALDRGRGPLAVLAIVHRIGAPDRWDLIVSSAGLQPWTMDALNYTNKHLQRELTSEQMIRIARIVVLPADNEVVGWLLELSDSGLGVLSNGLSDRFDNALVVWPNQ